MDSGVKHEEGRRQEAERSHGWFLGGGGAVGFAGGLAPAVQQAVEGGRAPHRGRRLQVHQVVVGLAHPRVLPLVAPPEEELCTLPEEAAWGEEAKTGRIEATFDI